MLGLGLSAPHDVVRGHRIGNNVIFYQMVTAVRDRFLRLPKASHLEAIPSPLL